jgi:hypothetical protein
MNGRRNPQILTQPAAPSEHPQADTELNITEHFLRNLVLGHRGHKRGAHRRRTGPGRYLAKLAVPAEPRRQHHPNTA